MRQKLLTEMQQLISESDSNVTMRMLNDSPEYHEQRSILYDAIQEEYGSLNEEIDYEDITLGELIASMSSKKLDLLFTKLKTGSHGPSISAFLEVYESTDNSPEAERFRNFLSNNELKILSAGNCINILCSPIDGSKKQVLKLDGRMGRAKTLETHLRAEQTDYLATLHAERYARGMYNSGVVNVVDFYEFGSLYSYREKEPEEAVRQTTTIFRKMAKTFEEMQQRNVIFFDSKLDNWLIDRDRLVCIADTKSFASITDGRVIYGDAGSNAMIVETMEDVIKTPGFDIPERMTGKDGYRAEPVSAYLLGKNLYYYLNGKNMIVEGKLRFEGTITDITGTEHTIDADLFTGIPGKLYKSLIEALTHENPSKRISLQHAQSLLTAIDNINQKVMARSNSDVLEPWAVEQFQKLLSHPDKAEHYIEKLNINRTPPMRRRTLGQKMLRKSARPELGDRGDPIGLSTEDRQREFKRELQGLKDETSIDITHDHTPRDDDNFTP